MKTSETPYPAENSAEDGSFYVSIIYGFQNHVKGYFCLFSFSEVSGSASVRKEKMKKSFCMPEYFTSCEK